MSLFINKVGDKLFGAKKFLMDENYVALFKNYVYYLNELHEAID